MSCCLDMSGVTVRFSRFTLGPLDLRLETGKIVGLIGPNGSGKTTTIRCIAGNLRYQGGTIAVNGRAATTDDGAWKQETGYVPDRPDFYEYMTAQKHLAFVSGFYRNWSDSLETELTRRFRLDGDQKIRHMSTGNRVKLALVSALAHNPRLALFDEPTAGLDPVVRLEVFDVLGELMEHGDRTIVYSTHVMDDLHRLADDLVFLKNGNIQLHAEKDSLIDSWREITCRLDESDPIPANAILRDRDEQIHCLLSSNGEKTINELKSHNAEILGVRPMTLEDIAVHIMKEESC